MIVKHSFRGAFLLPAMSLVLAACSDREASPASETAQASGATATRILTEIEAIGLYELHCASCHGASFEGGARGPELSPDAYRYGGELEDHRWVIANGIEAQGMPAYRDTLSEDEILALAALMPANLPAPADAAEAAPPPPRVFDAAPGTTESLDYAIRAEVFVDGLETPWGMAFLDDRTALITERAGRLRLVRDGVLEAAPIAGVPDILVSEHRWNQGGLLDVAIDPDYEANGWVYLAYSHALESEAGEAELRGMTRVVRGRIRDGEWVDQETVFEANPSEYTTVPWHYGGRIAIDDTGHLFISVGDRYVEDQSRELDRANGKIHRVTVDGRIPPDNPFIDQDGALASIYSYGNRNAQGMALAPDTGALWQTEHGPRGGDEINIIRSGRDYGWPIASYGINYDGSVLTPHTRLEGVEQPVYYWRPSIGVSGMVFYQGAEFPLWRNKLLVTGLGSRDLRLITLDGERVQHEEIIFRTEGRPYEPIIGPDDAIYILTDAPGQVIRLSAEEERRR